MQQVSHHVRVNALCSSPVIGRLAIEHFERMGAYGCRWVHICSYIHSNIHQCSKSQGGGGKKEAQLKTKSVFANFIHCAIVEVTKSTKVTQRV